MAPRISARARWALPAWLAGLVAVAHILIVAAVLLNANHIAVLIAALGALATAAGWLGMELAREPALTTRLARLAQADALIYMLGCAIVGNGMAAGLYSSDAPTEVLITASAIYVIGLPALARLASRSRLAFHLACLAQVLVTGIAAYCLYAIAELLAELPVLVHEHTTRPALIHVVNVTLASGLFAFCAINCVSLLGLAIRSTFVATTPLIPTDHSLARDPP